MARPLVEVEGARRLRKTLRAAGSDLTELKEVHREAATTVQRAAQPSAPVRTGRLQSTVRVGATKTAGIVRAGRKSAPYAGPIHWGWPARNIEAQPFLADAAKRTEPVWVPRFEARVKEILEKVKGK